MERQTLSADRRSERGSWSLIGMLAALVIMMVLTLILLGGPQALTGGKKGGSGGGMLGNIEGAGGAVAVRNEARETVCANNLQQIRTALQMAGTNEEGYPQTLQELAQANPGLQIVCPVGGEPYNYDPTTGKVSCVHPGHERN
jgi:hypothetical protein